MRELTVRRTRVSARAQYPRRVGRPKSRLAEAQHHIASVARGRDVGANRAELMEAPLRGASGGERERVSQKHASFCDNARGRRFIRSFTITTIGPVLLLVLGQNPGK